MHRRSVITCCVYLVLITPAFAQSTQTERLTITTYYPSPTGVYNQLQAQRMVIGDVNADGQLNAADVPVSVRPFYVQNSSGDGFTAAFVNPAGYGVAIGAPDAYTVGAIQSNYFQNGGGATPVGANLSINPSGGLVVIGKQTPWSWATLDVYSRTSLGMVSIAGVSDSGNSYSAVFLHDDSTDFDSTWVVDHLNKTGTTEENNLVIGKYIAGPALRRDINIQNATGNVGIGTSNPASKLQVIGDIMAGNATTPYNMTAGAFFYMSDRALKTGIEPAPNSLQKVLSLTGMKFHWKKDGRQDMGLIAQDVEQVYPELVSTDPVTGLKSIEYGNLIAPLIEAVKEQQKQIDMLRNKIEQMETRTR